MQSSTWFDFNSNSSLLSIHLQFQNATKKMKLKLEIRSDVGSVVTESCTKRGQKEVSFSPISIDVDVCLRSKFIYNVSDPSFLYHNLVSKFSNSFFFTAFHYVLPKELHFCHSFIQYIFF